MEKQWNVRRQWLRKLLRIHSFVFALSLGVYFLCAFFDPGLLSYDLRQKFRALAVDTVAITATVLGSPVQPVVTANALCNATNGTLSVAIDWADDVNTYTYDIHRDSLPLVTGLVSSLYTDTTIAVGTIYQYEVIAHGPMGPGIATSLPVTVTTPSVCAITSAAPSVTIVSFGGRNIDSYDGTPRIGNKRPLFSGTTSMPGATLLVAVGSDFFAQFTANANGYWEWRPPQGLSLGSHIFTITATDPNNGTRQATATLRFDILRRDDTSSHAVSSAKGVSTTLSGAGTLSGISSPMNFSFVVENTDALVTQGEVLRLTSAVRQLRPKYTHITVPIRYSILDENQGLLFSETHDTYIEEGVVIHQAITIPLYILPGKYFVQGEILLDGINLSRTASFTVQELPLLQLSSGAVITYADMIRNLGWISFLALIFFLLWLFLLIREYGLYLQGDHEVAAYELKKAGYIRK